ncbi:ChbG/HpnK family deacetylase [Solirhodobacter olei]|uniref:ChbG/HpnK family deacetylase n=1 Tax=Solirhodobacter olei TaxID=2493082 RepID=UPI000FD78B2C|nr:ChbG/HpnK family deacetylase [Solirhodobacter olei]
MRAPPSRFLLIADDFGLTPDVSAGIAELARAGRLSGTSALVTIAGWSEGGPDVHAVRDAISLGLHINLTLGTPLGVMPDHAPGGRLPPVSHWIARAFTGRIIEAEVEAEIDRQFEAFEEAVGAPPDHVDGHHHIHALPGIRSALVRTLRRRFPNGRLPLVRLPGDRASRILARRASVPKALLVATLSVRARAALRAVAAPTNDGFSGFSGFRLGHPFADELARFASVPGPAHLVMCHPGHIDADAPTGDPVEHRRAEELAALEAEPSLPERLLHPARHRDASGTIDWEAVFAD